MRSWLAAACALTCAGISTAQGAERLPKMVVLGIKPLDESTLKISATITEILTTDLSKLGRFEVMGESEIGSLVGFERQKQLLGCNDSACLAELGGALGSDYLLLGTLGKVGEQLRVDVKIVDVKHSKVGGRDGVTVDNVKQLVEAGRTALKGALASLGGAAKPPAEAHAVSKGPGVAPYVVVGVGAAAVVAGGLLTGLTVAGKKDLTYSQANARATSGLVVAGVGLAAVVAGIVWAAVGSSSPSPSSATVGLVPTSGGATLCASGSF